MKEESMQMLLHQIVHLMGHMAVERLAVYELKPWQAGILFTLYNTEGLSQKELAKMTRVTPPTMTVAIKKMEEQGYITRVQDENDQRILRLFITEKGKNCIIEAKEVFAELEEILLSKINQEERLLLMRLLHQMRTTLTENTKEKSIHFCPHDLD